MDKKLPFEHEDALYEERHTPNAETIAAIKEVESGNGVKSTIDELLEFVDSIKK